MKRKMILIPVMLALGFLSARNILAQNAGQKYRTGSEQGNEMILAASSPFEDMTEAALAGDRKGIERALRAYDAQAGKVENILPAAKRNELRILVADIRKAKNQGSLAAIVLEQGWGRCLQVCINQNSFPDSFQNSMLVGLTHG